MTGGGQADQLRILIWGGGSKARIVIRMIEEIYGDRASLVGIFDPYISELNFSADCLLYNQAEALTHLLAKSSHFIVCIGGENGYARYTISEHLVLEGLEPLSLMSRYAIFDDVSFLGQGVQAMPGSVVHKFSSIGRYCILNTNSTVDHECVLGDGVHVMGGASIAGRVDIGSYSTIGTNATVLPDLRIGRNVFVGAGAVVTKNIEDGVVVAGVPARVIRPVVQKDIDIRFFVK